MGNFTGKQILFAVVKLDGATSLRSVVLVLAGAITAIACAWSASTDRSVRFNDFRTGRGFYRLPPLPLMYNAQTGREISTRQVEDYDFYGDDFDWENRVVDGVPVALKPAEDAWNNAMTAIESGKLAEAQTLLEKFLTLTHYPPIDEYEPRQPRRNSAVDILDAMTALRQGSGGSSVKVYLKARHAYDDPSSPVNNDEFLKQSQADKNLKDNWSYLEGAQLYKFGQKEEALAVFSRFATMYPRSEKTEAASYMEAKLTMESSFAFGNLKCGIEGKKRWGDPVDSNLIEPKEKCQDDAWRTGIESFQQLIRRYPNGRYVDDARGWLAYLYRRGGDRAKALAEYYRLLGHPTDLAVRLEAKKSIEMIGHEYGDGTLDEVEKLISDDSNAAMAYAYHRIYNQAIDFTYEKREDYCCFGEDRLQQEVAEDERVDKAVKGGRHELERVVGFATAMLKRYPNARVSGGFLLRIAEAQLELQNYNETLTFAKNALSSGVEGDLRAQALWVKGSAEHQRKEFRSAAKTFDQLIAEFPKSKYIEGSRRILAMVAEDRGDLETALEIYIALKYETDIAYFVDVLMPTDRFAKFVEGHKNIPEYNQFLYGVGVRYMREKRWAEARETLRRVQTEKGTDEYLTRDKDSTFYFPKEPFFYAEEGKHSYVKTSWVMQDLKTIDIFEHYEKAVDIAQGDEAKAEAMYQLASAFFEADDLVFYNPAAWGGGRSGALSQLQFSDHERFPTESQLIFEHLQMHDPWARSIPLYEEIVARFPQTKVARDAMYSAAVAHERLAGRIGPWTIVYERGLFAGPRMLTYADVRSRYPDYQLPRGTYGWKPSTRTVNGGPGWAPPAKPLPRESREHKIKRLLREFKDELSGASTKLSSAVQTKVEAGVASFGAMIEAALYGIISGIGLWLLICVGANFHVGRHVGGLLLPRFDGPPEIDSRLEALPPSESRVEKFLDT